VSGVHGTVLGSDAFYEFNNAYRIKKGNK
jgi:hypothetical protein